MDLLVGEARGAAHQTAAETVHALVALGVDAHFYEEAAAIFVRLERAPAIGQRFGQHWDHPIGKIDRVAATACLSVKRRAWTHVVGDVGDGDEEAEAVPICFGVNGVVEVARILAVDREQRRVAQVSAAAKPGGARSLGLGKRQFWEDIGDGVSGNADQADRTGIAEAAEPLDDARGAQAEMTAGGLRQRFGKHDVVGHGTEGLAGGNDPLGL